MRDGFTRGYGKTSNRSNTDSQLKEPMPMPSMMARDIPKFESSQSQPIIKLMQTPLLKEYEYVGPNPNDFEFLPNY
jgi:hypothetical protein